MKLEIIECWARTVAWVSKLGTHFHARTSFTGFDGKYVNVARIISRRFPVSCDGPTQCLSYSFRNVSQNTSMFAKNDA